MSGAQLLAADFASALETALARSALPLRRVAPGAPIPGSYWGEPEAGLSAAAVWYRDDTPLHSLLHEAGHALCMDGARRAVLERDAGGGCDEENAVCYLQIVLATELGVGAERLMRDMDAWGYTFRLGSARAWFEGESDAAREWLIGHGLLDATGRSTGRARG